MVILAKRPSHLGCLSSRPIPHPTAKLNPPISRTESSLRIALEKKAQKPDDDRQSRSADGA